MRKKYNNESNNIKEWTTKKLKEEAISYHQSIYEIESYGMSDIRMYEALLSELDSRGIDISSRLAFE